MHVVFHLGSHCTDEDRLVRCLLKNKGRLAAEGIVVPGPSRYRTMLRDTLAALHGAQATPEAQAVLLDALMDEDEAVRLILSNDQFLCFADRVLEGGTLYADAGTRVAAIANLFPQNDRSLFLSIRNPATFIPALLGRMKKVSYADFVGQTDLMALRWSGVIAAIRAAVPALPLTVWSNEDTPLIWPELIAAITGHNPATPVAGLYDLVSEIMSPHGMKAMQSYLSSHKPQNTQQRRRIVSAFLTKFSLPDKIEMELDLPGWTTELVEDLTDQYEDDILEIRKMPGVTFLAL